MDVDSGDFAIIVPNTKFLMFYNCFGYLYYSICSPREERLGMLLLINLISIESQSPQGTPRAQRYQQDTGYLSSSCTRRLYVRHSALWCRFQCQWQCRRLLFCSMYDIIFSLLDSAAPSLSLVVYWCQYCCCYYSDSSNSDRLCYLCLYLTS